MYTIRNTVMLPVLNKRLYWHAWSSQLASEPVQKYMPCMQCCGSVVCFFLNPDPTLQMVSDTDPDPIWICLNIYNINFTYVFSSCNCVELHITITRFSNWAFCWEILKFDQFSKVVLCYINFGSGSTALLTCTVLYLSAWCIQCIQSRLLVC
jgi:hypothetical protein